MNSKTVEVASALLPSDPAIDPAKPIDQYDRSFSGGVLHHLSPPDSAASQIPPVTYFPR